GCRYAAELLAGEKLLESVFVDTFSQHLARLGNQPRGCRFIEPVGGFLSGAEVEEEADTATTAMTVVTARICFSRRECLCAAAAIASAACWRSWAARTCSSRRSSSAANLSFSAARHARRYSRAEFSRSWNPGLVATFSASASLVPAKSHAGSRSLPCQAMALRSMSSAILRC